MHPAFVKLVTILLLVVQGLVAPVTGRVLCIALEDCEFHDKRLTALCGHCDAAVCHANAFAQSESGRDLGMIPAADHPEDECACHVHVPVPGDQQVPCPAKTDGFEFRSSLVPFVLAIFASWEIEPPVSASVRLHPPDFSSSDQILALKSTRLHI
jgi:hypothetical protein